MDELLQTIREMLQTIRECSASADRTNRAIRLAAILTGLVIIVVLIVALIARYVWA